MPILFDPSGLDLAAYFDRVGGHPPPRPTFDALASLVRAHTEAIPFENLNPLLGWPVHLDLRSLEEKIVRNRRGGFCFEQNLLFGHVLRALGYNVTGLAARVLWNQPPGAITPRTHMLLRIELDDGPCLADVGFGALTPTAPLRLELDVVQPSPHERFRITAAGADLVLEAIAGPRHLPMYRFDLRAQYLPDYQLANWYVCTHPSSHFRSNLSVARAAPGRRYTLRDTELTVHHLDGEPERTTLTSAPAIHAALEDVFGIAVPEVPEMDSILAMIASRANRGSAGEGPRPLAASKAGA